MYVVVLSNQFLSCCKLKHLGRRTLSFKSRYRVATQEHGEIKFINCFSGTKCRQTVVLVIDFAAGQSVQQTFGPARGAELV